MAETKRQARLSAPAISRILSAAGIKHSRPHLDVEALASCIDVCVDLYDHAKLFNTQTIDKKTRAELTKVLRTASRLTGQVDSLSPRSFLPSHSQAQIHLSKLVEEVERILELHSWTRPRAALKEELPRPRTSLEYDYVNSLAYENHFKSKSPLQWLVGVYLVEVYEIFVGVRDRRYLAFAYQILKELRIKDGNSYHSREAIARAARGYSRKRKLAPVVDQDEWAINRQMQFSWACGVHKSLNPWTELLRREREKAAAAKIGKE